jgi:threonyl-tRNA synthetase
MAKYAKGLKIEVYRAPFGWCKEFSISTKGHPLAEQFRSFNSKREDESELVSKALVSEKKIKSTWFIILPNAELIPVDKFDFTAHKNLEKFYKYEISKRRGLHKDPPHISLMKRLELADYEPASDSGNFRWYPKGRLIKFLLEQFVTEKMEAYGAMEVETPIMYDLEHPALVNYLNRFPARQYIVKSEEKEYFLRFSACFGQFLIIRDAQISYRQLPLKIYELTKYSFRREKSGELVGLRRLRAFTMPDCHAFCANIDQTKEELLKRFKLSYETLEGLDLTKNDYELAIRFTKDFYINNKPIIVSLVENFDKPALVEIWDEKIFYFVLKWEFNFFAILEKAHMEKIKGKAPMLPLWLTPTQVRVIPISEEFFIETEKITNYIAKHNIRADWDDRPLTMQKKIREAEMEWIPYIVLIGQKEIDSKILAVRDRSKRVKNIKMKKEELISEVKKKTEEKPFKQLGLPMALSERPRFYG